MQTECSAKPSAFGRVESRPVVAEFDGGALTSDAGGLLLGAADRRLDLVRRIARCFRDARDPVRRTLGRHAHRAARVRHRAPGDTVTVGGRGGSLPLRVHKAAGSREGARGAAARPSLPPQCDRTAAGTAIG